MSVEWTWASEGNRFSPTKEGNEIGRVRAKYDAEYWHREEYARKVPTSWIRNEWVKEVTDNE